MTIRVAINGAGRIGRAFYKLSRKNPDVEVVAINDLGDAENIAYLLKYDSVYGISDFSVEAKEGALVIDGQEVKFLSEKDPRDLPWRDMNIDVVVESTGVFTKYEEAKAHLEAGAKRVVISAPGKGDEAQGATILMGVNEDRLNTCEVSSNGSCTTNAVSPVLAVIDEAIGVEKAILNTVHSYTASQSLVDGPNKKDWREGRAAAQNIVPSTTGAAIAVEKALEGLEGKFDGVSIRVPSVIGSIADLTFVTKRDTTPEEINKILEDATKTERWKDILEVVHDPIVSSDVKGAAHASIVDAGFTRVVGGNLVKVLAWYDNEIGYTHTLLDHVIKAGNSK